MMHTGQVLSRSLVLDAWIWRWEMAPVLARFAEEGKDWLGFCRDPGPSASVPAPGPCGCLHMTALDLALASLLRLLLPKAGEPEPSLGAWQEIGGLGWRLV